VSTALTATRITLPGPAEFQGPSRPQDRQDLPANGATTGQVHNVDFRSVYATVLDRVVGVDSVSVLGARFATLPFV
jgi:hypothetical protein